jgi:hypothetical protein
MGEKLKKTKLNPENCGIKPTIEMPQQMSQQQKASAIALR